MEEIQPKKKTNYILQYGLIAGLVSLLIFVLLYVGGTEAMGNSFAIFIPWAIQIGIAVFACIKAKKENEGFLDFRQALKISFGVLVICTLVTSLFNYILVNFIDRGFGERMVQLTIEKTQSIMEKFGAPQDAIDKALKEITFDSLYSLKKVFQSFMMSCIVQFIVALIVSAIVKKKRPEFAQ